MDMGVRSARWPLPALRNPLHLVCSRPMLLAAAFQKRCRFVQALLRNLLVLATLAHAGGEVQLNRFTTAARTSRCADLQPAWVAHFFFFGASTMIIWRPSIFGICST